MFYFLDGYYVKNKDDTLGYLLSGFNPNLWVDSMSADPAAWEDWINTAKKITSEETMTSHEAFNATREFIIFHQNEFGFDLKWLIEELNALSAESKEWLECVSKVLA